MGKRLSRSCKDRMIGGVCAGLARYLGLDVILVRLFFVLLALGSGVGVFVYLLLWVITPHDEQGDVTPAETIQAGAEEMAARARALGEELQASIRRPHPQTGLLIGGALVVLGILFLLQNLDIAWLRWLNIGVLWPLLLVAGGVALLRRRGKGD